MAKIASLLFISIFLINIKVHSEELSKDLRQKDLADVLDTLEKHYGYWWQKNFTSNTLRMKYQPLIEKNTDPAKHYELLNEIIFELHDGHGGVVSPFAENESVNAGFKIEKIENKYFVTEVNPNSDLSKKIEVGFELKGIDNIPPEDYRKKFDILPSGTLWAWDAIKTELLASVPLGVSRKFFFLKNDKKIEVSVLIKNPSSVNYIRSISGHSAEQPVVSYLQMNETAYIRINGFSTKDEPARKFINFLKEANKNNAKSLIIDLRYSIGGSGEEAAEMMSALLDKGLVLGEVWGPPCNPEKNHSCIVKQKKDLKLQSQLKSETAKYLFAGKVMTLVGPLCRSACELFAGFLKYSTRSKLVGLKTSGAVSSYICGHLPSSSKYPDASMCVSNEPVSIFGNFLEGIGVEPDISISRKISDIVSEKDTVLVEAKRLLR